MKKLTLMAILLSLALVACGEKKVEEVKETATQAVEQVKETATEAVADVKDKANEAVTEVKESAEKTMADAKDKANEVMTDAKDKANEVMADALKFKTADGTEYNLNINGDNAVLKTSTGEEYNLKAAVSGSGVRFADEKGNEIHYKGESGVVNLNGKESTVELVK